MPKKKATVLRLSCFDCGNRWTAIFTSSVRRACPCPKCNQSVKTSKLSQVRLPKPYVGIFDDNTTYRNGQIVAK